jgi:hypothetical protein
MQNSTASFDIDLIDIRAKPNPANFHDEVKIMAVFGNVSSNLTSADNPSKIIDLTHLTVSADIINSAGLDIGKVNLRPSSGPDGSKTFNDVLQIVVIGMAN